MALSHKSLHPESQATLAHKKKVEQFNFCTCEEQEQFPYDDCPRIENKTICGDCLYPIDKCKGCKS
jgi:hypothetical protein